MEVTVESKVRQDFKSSCECLKTNLDQSQVESNGQITGPQRYIHVHVLHVCTHHKLCIETIDFSLIATCDLMRFVIHCGLCHNIM